MAHFLVSYAKVTCANPLKQVFDNCIIEGDPTLWLWQRNKYDHYRTYVIINAWKIEGDDTLKHLREVIEDQGSYVLGENL